MIVNVMPSLVLVVLVGLPDKLPGAERHDR